MDFPERCKWLRKEREWSQTELAEIAGLLRDQITGYETGRYLPGFEALHKLSLAFQCSVDFLMTGRESPFPPREEPTPKKAKVRKKKKKKKTGPKPKVDVVRLETRDQRSPRPRRSRGV